MNETYDFSVEFGSVAEFAKVKADIAKFRQCRKRIQQLNPALNSASNQSQSNETTCTNINPFHNCFKTSH